MGAMGRGRRGTLSANLHHRRRRSTVAANNRSNAHVAGSGTAMASAAALAAGDVLPNRERQKA